MKHDITEPSVKPNVQNQHTSDQTQAHARTEHVKKLSTENQVWPSLRLAGSIKYIKTKAEY